MHRALYFIDFFNYIYINLYFSFSDVLNPSDSEKFKCPRGLHKWTVLRI